MPVRGIEGLMVLPSDGKGSIHNAGLVACALAESDFHVESERGNQMLGRILLT
jgi:hypothetical protein